MSDAKADNTLYLIDGSGYIFRAYYALPPLTRADGTPVGAVMGFCNMMHKLRADLTGKKASHAAVIFDAARKTFRNDIYPEYKAHRPPPPDDLIPQFALVKEAARAFGFPSIEHHGFEADDIIAAYAYAAEKQGWNVVVVSADKDLMQLMNEKIQLFDPMKNQAVTLEKVIEKFGVPPEKVVDVQALAGDSTDNIPGAPGIGVKTAAQLIQEYGSLDNLLARAGEIKQPKRRAILVDNQDQIRISKKLVTLDNQAPIPIALDDLHVKANDAELHAFLNAMGFKNLLSRINGKPEIAKPAEDFKDENREPEPKQGSKIDNSFQEKLIAAKADYELILSLDPLKKWCAAAKEKGVVAVDTETDSLLASTTTLVGVSLALEAGQACYIPLNHTDPKGENKAGELNLGDTNRPMQIPFAAAIAELKTILEDPSILKIGHNLKFDRQVLGQHKIDVGPFDDTMLISFVLAAGLHGHSLDELADLHLRHKMIGFNDVTGTGKARISFAQVPLDKACDYAAEDADYTLRLYHFLKPQLLTNHLVTLYERIERPMVRVVADMEKAGVKIDTQVLKTLSNDFALRLAHLEESIHKEAGVAFNIASPKQLGEVLFEKLKLPAGKKSKTGAFSTSSDILEPLAEQGHGIVQRILDWRGLAKLKSTYTDALPEQISPKTGRVHTSFSLVGAATGRFSSTDPNLQNIPIRTEDGRNIRRAFVAERGFELMSVDYSQIELRLAAEMADVKALKDAFAKGHDIHAATAASVFGLALSAVTPEQRRQAKAINFGIIYGISGFGLAKQINCTVAEANHFIRDYLDRFSEIRAFMETTKEKARAQGYVETLYGRRIHINGIHDKNPARRNFAERQAINAPLQGSAADILKRAMAKIPDALKENNLAARMILQVHDELLFEVPVAEKEQTAALIKVLMEGAAQLSIPLVVDAGFAPNWADAH